MTLGLFGNTKPRRTNYFHGLVPELDLLKELVPKQVFEKYIIDTELVLSRSSFFPQNWLAWRARARVLASCARELRREPKLGGGRSHAL